MAIAGASVLARSRPAQERGRVLAIDEQRHLREERRLARDQVSWESIRRSNTYTPQFWYAGGPTRPKLQDIAIRALRDFGVTTYAEPERNAPPGDLTRTRASCPA